MGICTKLLARTNEFVSSLPDHAISKLQLDETEYELSTLRSHCDQIRNEWQKYKQLKQSGFTSINNGSGVVIIDTKTKQLSVMHNQYAQKCMSLDQQRKQLKRKIQKLLPLNYLQPCHNKLDQHRTCTNVYQDY